MQLGERDAVRVLTVGIAALVFALYVKTASFGFVFDDEFYLVRNPRVAAGLTAEGMRWALGSLDLANWHPLTWISHLADVSLFGMRPGPMHLVNAAFHALVAALLFAVLRAATGTLLPSAASALLFAVHPLRVESVAWISERKDLLCALFWVLGLLAWVRYARRPGAARYALVAALFVLALLGKPMAVTFPLALLLLDWWPLGRFGDVPRSGRALRLVAEKLPLLALSAVSAALTVLAQGRAGTVQPWESYPLGVRLANALISYAAYAGKTLWPSGLAVFYPHPGRDVSFAAAAGAAALLALSIAAAFALRRAHPWLLLGALWYLGTLVPVIGIVQVAAQAMADRYAYLPSFGLVLAAAWEAARLARRRPRTVSALAVAAIALPVLLAAATWGQLDHWRTQRALFTRALAVTRENPLAHYNLGNLDAAEGRPDGAIAHFREAVRINPRFADARVNLAVHLAARGDLDEAGRQYEEALRLAPLYPEAHLNYGSFLLRRGSRAGALRHLREAVRLAPGLAVAHMNLANALDEDGRLEEALAHYGEALRLAPGDPEVRWNLGVALENAGRREEATEAYREVLRLSPAHEGARAGLARLR